MFRKMPFRKAPFRKYPVILSFSPYLIFSSKTLETQIPLLYASQAYFKG